MKPMFAYVDTETGKVQDFVVNSLQTLFTSLHCTFQNLQYDVHWTYKTSMAHFLSKTPMRKYQWFNRDIRTAAVSQLTASRPCRHFKHVVVPAVQCTGTQCQKRPHRVTSRTHGRSCYFRERGYRLAPTLPRPGIPLSLASWFKELTPGPRC